MNIRYFVNNYCSSHGRRIELKKLNVLTLMKYSLIFLKIFFIVNLLNKLPIHIFIVIFEIRTTHFTRWCSNTL